MAIVHHVERNFFRSCHRVVDFVIQALLTPVVVAVYGIGLRRQIRHLECTGNTYLISAGTILIIGRIACYGECIRHVDLLSVLPLLIRSDSCFLDILLGNGHLVLAKIQGNMVFPRYHQRLDLSPLHIIVGTVGQGHIDSGGRFHRNVYVVDSVIPFSDVQVILVYKFRQVDFSNLTIRVTAGDLILSILLDHL